MSLKKLNRALKGRPELVQRLLMVAESSSERRHISSPEDLYSVVAPYLVGLEVENLVAVAMNRTGHVIGVKTLSIGSDGFTVVDPRIIYRWALTCGKLPACSVAIAHNHPAGSTTPSDPDCDVTRRVKAAGRVLGIPLHDHLIIGGTSYYSFAESGEL